MDICHASILFPKTGVVKIVVDQFYGTCPVRVLYFIIFVDTDGLLKKKTDNIQLNLASN